MEKPEAGVLEEKLLFDAAGAVAMGSKRFPEAREIRLRPALWRRIRRRRRTQ